MSLIITVVVNLLKQSYSASATSSRMCGNQTPRMIPMRALVTFILCLCIVALICVYIVYLLGGFQVWNSDMFIDSISMSSFNLNRSSSQLTANWSVELLVVNNDRRHHVQYSNFNMYLLYGGRGIYEKFYLGKAENIASFEQNPKTKTKLTVEPKVKTSSMDSWVASLMAYDQEMKGSITFDILLKVHIRREDLDAWYACNKLEVVISASNSTFSGAMVGGPKRCFFRSFLTNVLNVKNPFDNFK